MRVDLDNGKYTYVFEDGKQWVLRNGKPWMTSDECAGNNVLFFMAHRIEELEKSPWISVEDELPPCDTPVLTWCGDSDIEPEIDYMDIEVEYGTQFWANSSFEEAKYWAYMPELLEPPCK